MNYYKIQFDHSLNETQADLLMYALGEIGFESFEAEDGKLSAYIPEDTFEEKALDKLMSDWEEQNIRYEKQFVEEQNWNAVWESQYDAVLFGDYCFVHAPFHSPREDVKYNIIIEPKMSFGTAHHPTTSLIIEYIAEEPLTNKRLLDMGCGTGVLAILAKKEGARDVEAIDNDQWAYENTIENIERNNTSDIKVVLGDATVLENKEFDCIIANINRNILLRDIGIYAQCLPKGGILFLSGFYQEDIAQLEAECNRHRLFYVSNKTKENWAALKFIKK